MLDKRDMLRSDWTRILDKKQTIQSFSYGNKTGKMSLLKILDCKEPLVKDFEGDKVTLVENNYSWLQLAFEGEYAWFTVMFDDNDKLLQIYIDITDGNDTNKDNPTFNDMYLDYVVYKHNIHELDRDELLEAYHNGNITLQQYERTIEEGEKIVRLIKENMNETYLFFEKEYLRMKNT